MFDRAPYRGASDGRAFGLGGTSALWGGQLLPVRPADLLARAHVAAWPIDHASIAAYFKPLQQLLGVARSSFDGPGGSLDAAARAELDYTGWWPRRSQWLPFGQRNLASRWLGRLVRDPRCSVWIHCTEREWQCAGPVGTRSVARLRLRSAAGHTVTVRPGRIVVAAGALEAVRVLAEISEASGGLGGGADQHLGRHLHDHLSVRIARLEVLDRAAFAARFAPRFEGRSMRSLRMEPEPGVLAHESLPPMYAHIVAEAGVQSGFALVRDTLRALQMRDWRAMLGHAARMPRALPDIVRLVYGRLVRRRLEFPADSALYVHVDFEQSPQAANRVYLGAAAGNGGSRVLHVDWQADQVVPEVARKVQALFARFWARNSLDGIARLEFLDPGDRTEDWTRNVYDIYHPAGTTRMGADEHSSVVDRDLKVHGLANVYVVGSSVFPSMGAANPTFTAMALALRLAEHLAG